MREVILALTLVSLVPVVLSFSYNDCDNCLRCEGGKCRQCEEGYAITKIYSRRLCVTECGGDEGKVWDPVLESYICDKRRNCSKYAIPNCQECLRSYSCVMCKDNYALKMKGIGYNVCHKTCDQNVEPRSGAKVCKMKGDCDNCLRCEGGKCRQCEEGYAITMIYSRRLCVTECGGDEGKVWDPVLESYICDKRRNCSQNDNASCQKCLRSYSCVKCAEGYALKMVKIGNLDIIGYNQCDGDCENCVEPRSGVKVCKGPGAVCHATEPANPETTNTVQSTIDPITYDDPDEKHDEE